MAVRAIKQHLESAVQSLLNLGIPPSALHHSLIHQLPLEKELAQYLTGHIIEQV